MSHNERSRHITHGVARAPNRAMYYALGYQEADFENPMIGVANGHSTITPCNSGLQRLADAAIEAIRGAKANPQVFGTPTISDGMSMGTEGMKYSLVSREVIADCIETAAQGQWMDGVVVIGGCDKNMPGGMIALARMNVPGIYVYGGTIKPGRYQGKDLTIVSVFEAVGEYTMGRMEEADFKQIEKCAIPGSGSCGGMYTANTMSSAFEAMGMSLPYSSTMANEDDEKVVSAAESARVLVQAVRRGGCVRATSSRASPSRTPFPSSWQRAARPMPCCISWPSPTPPRCPGPSTTSNAFVSACRCCATSSHPADTWRPTCIAPAAFRRS